MTAEEIEQYIKEYGDDIFRFCCFLTGDRSKAQDLYQDTFLKAMEIEKSIAQEDAKKFLCGIAANLWKNQWRKEKRRQKIIAPVEFNGDYMSDQTIEQKMSPSTDVLDAYVNKETSRLVRRIVNELPEKYRIMVLLHYGADLTATEIAQQLHINRGTVTSGLLRARQRIKKGLEASGYER